MNPGAGLRAQGGVEELAFGLAPRGQAGARGAAGGAERGESRGGYWEGETSESFNPRDGFGMKQGREDVGGTTRHEVEKT